MGTDHFNLEHKGGRSHKHFMGTYTGMTCSLVLLLGITISVSAKTYMNVVPGNSELNSLRSDEPDDYEAGRRQHLLWPNDRSRENRERLLKLIVNFLDDDTLEKIGIKNMGEFSEAESKRAPFSSWGGKRSDELAEDVPLEPDVKRAPFSSWGGKKKRGGSSFSAWGGKRNTDLMDYIKAHLAARSRRDDSPIKVIRPARAAFSAWGGK